MLIQDSLVYQALYRVLGTVEILHLVGSQVLVCLHALVLSQELLLVFFELLLLFFHFFNLSPASLAFGVLLEQ